MLVRKTLFIVLLCFVPVSWAQQNAAQVYGFTKPYDIYPSKTHYLMVVDHHIQRFFNRYGVPYLLRLDTIPLADRHALLAGMRKAILHQASVSWDIGLVQYYGRDLDDMLGFKPASEDFRDISRVREQLIKYIQASDLARSVVARHHDTLISLWGADWQENNIARAQQAPCRAAGTERSDLVFYTALKTLETDKRRATSMAYRYELLGPCQRLQVQQQLETDGVGNIGELQQLLLQPETPPSTTAILVSTEK